MSMRTRSVFAAIALLVGPVEPSAAQTGVSKVRDLAFGSVPVGVATHVAPSDPVKSGEFQLVSPGGTTRVLLLFTLPALLSGPGGATLPISFNATDAIVVGATPANQPVTFDPRVLQTLHLVKPTAFVFIGGTVTPAAAQPLGTYTNTVILTVTLL